MEVKTYMPPEYFEEENGKINKDKKNGVLTKKYIEDEEDEKIKNDQ